ncbi:MAG: hypothetical protein IJW66_05315 [Clostridia bacterium]|nr:hypothetical protein [Clostridia bacterium]
MSFAWNKKWKTVLVWACAYLNFLALVLVGGYFYVKKDDEEVQTASRHAFITTLIFSAVSALLSVYNYIGGFVDSYYSSAAYELYSSLNALAGIARIVVFAVFIILAIVKKETATADVDAPKE